MLRDKLKQLTPRRGVIRRHGALILVSSFSVWHITPSEEDWKDLTMGEILKDAAIVETRHAECKVFDVLLPYYGQTPITFFCWMQIVVWDEPTAGGAFGRIVQWGSRPGRQCTKDDTMRWGANWANAQRPWKMTVGINHSFANILAVASIQPPPKEHERLYRRSPTELAQEFTGEFPVDDGPYRMALTALVPVHWPINPSALSQETQSDLAAVLDLLIERRTATLSLSVLSVSSDDEGFDDSSFSDDISEDSAA